MTPNRALMKAAPGRRATYMEVRTVMIIAGDDDG